MSLFLFAFFIYFTYICINLIQFYMKKKNLIFLMGNSRTGKDHTALKINELSHGGYHIVGFADALKKNYYESVGIEYTRETEDHELKEKHRAGIISYGESMKHENGKCHWIEAALDELLLDKENTKGIIVPDCRRTEETQWFDDFKQRKLEEYKEIRDDWKVHFIGIHRPGREIADKDYLTEVAIRAASDNYLFTGFINNDKGIKELNQSVMDFYVNKLK